MSEKLRECPACAIEGPADATECPYCGYEFPAGHGPFRVGVAVLLAVLLAWPLFELVSYLF